MSRQSAGGLAGLLDRLQERGEAPVVNPTKKPWEPPEPQRGAVWSFAVSFLLVFALIVFWFWFAGASTSFIYQGF